MSKTKCHICQKELTGGLDTYGDPHFELCFDCFWFNGDEDADNHYKQLGIKCGTCRRHQSATEWEVIDQDGMSQEATR